MMSKMGSECNCSNTIEIEVTRILSRLVRNGFMGENTFISSYIVVITSLLKMTFTK